MSEPLFSKNELDDQRQVLAAELSDWRDAGAPHEAVVDAIEALIDAKIAQRQILPIPGGTGLEQSPSGCGDGRGDSGITPGGAGGRRAPGNPIPASDGCVTRRLK